MRFKKVLFCLAVLSLSGCRSSPDEQLFQAIISDDADAVKAAVQRHGDVNTPLSTETPHVTPEDTTPLITACRAGKGQSVLALLEAGADPNLADTKFAYDDKGKTPLLYSITSQNRNLNIIETLLEHRADPNIGLPSPRRGPPVSFGNATDTTGATPLMLAATFFESR